MSESQPLAVFSSEFLRRVAEHEPEPLSAHEAGFAGPFKVEPRGQEFAVVREADGEVTSTALFRDTALLIAAALPIAGRGARFWLEDTDSQGSCVLKTLLGESGSATVAQLRGRHEEVPHVLGLLEHLLRSPTALSFFLEAASSEVLAQAGAILAKRLPNSVMKPILNKTPSGTVPPENTIQEIGLSEPV